MAFDPERKPRLPRGVVEILKERQDLFDPKTGEDEEGFTLEDAEALGWSVDLFDAHKHFPGRGLVRVRSTDSDEGRYGVRKAIYEYELREHERAKARAREICKRYAKALQQFLQALDAERAALEGAPAFERVSKEEWTKLSDEEWVARDAAHKRASGERRKANSHLRQANVFLEELCAFSRLELPEEFIDHLKETEPLDAARKERYERIDAKSKA